MNSQIKTIFAASSVFAAVLTACDDEKSMANYSADGRAIRIEATINSAYSGSDLLLNGSSFAEGDCVALSCDDGGLTFKLTDGAWTPTDKYYLVWYDTPTVYTAWYPVGNGIDAFTFSVPSNQQNISSLRNADYMTCSASGAWSGVGSQVLRLPLERRMAKVVMTLSGIGTDGKAQGVRIGSYQGYSGGEVVATPSLVTPYITVPAGGKSGQNGTVYTAVVVPGEANPNATFVSLNYLGDDLTFPGLPALSPGMTYTFDLNVAGSVIALSTVSVTPWTSSELVGGNASEVKLDAYYVRSEASGNATGMDWDNAMGADAFCSLIRTSSDASTTADNASRLDGKTIYLSGGVYEIAKDNSGVKVEYSGRSKQIEITVEGGYDPSLTGTDRSRRDILKYPTRLVRCTDSNASATNASMFVLGNQVDLSFDGVTFDGQYSLSDSGDTRCFYIAAGGSGDATLRLDNCVITNFNRCADSGTDGGAALKVSKGWAALTDVEIYNNSAKARGGAITSNNAASYVFLNRCLLHDNYAPSAWGTAVHAGNGYFCSNNTTFVGTQGSATTSVTVNGDAYFFLANTTIVGASGNTNGVFRSGKYASVLVNSLFVRGGATRTIFAGNITSKGYNAFQSADSGWGATELDTDLTNATLPTVLTDKVYQWSIGSLITSFATRQAILEALDSYASAASSKFRTWVGDEGFGLDCRGAQRNIQKMQPGAYDAGL